MSYDLFNENIPSFVRSFSYNLIFQNVYNSYKNAEPGYKKKKTD